MKHSNRLAVWMSSVCLLTVAGALAGCQGDPEGSPPVLREGALPIVNGSADPLTLTLTEGQRLAIGWLHPTGSPGANYCTATLIGPDLVVTASHCTGGSASNISFGIGPQPSNAVASFRASAVVDHPSVDMALIVLEEDATAVVEGLTPIPANAVAITGDDIGTALDAAGYGNTYGTNPEGRWFARVYLDEVDSTEIVVDGRGEQGICYGDSGGPVLWEGEAGPVVLAVESWGDESCVDRDHMTRLDPLVDDFITPISNGELPPDPCEGLEPDGLCDGDVLKFCRRGSPREFDCGALGTSCGFVSPDVGYGCECGDLDFIGRCDGEVLEYCDDGRYRQQDCEFQNRHCGYVDDNTGYACLDEVPTCEPGTEDGVCQGSVLVTCDRGVTETSDCANAGLGCVQSSGGGECARVDEPETPETPELPTPTGPDPNVVEGDGGAGDGGGCSQAGMPGGATPVGLALFALVGLAVRRRR